MTTTARALLLAAAFFSTSLHSADAPKQDRPVSRAPVAAQETSPVRSQLFDRLDANRDGFLSQLELDADPALRGNWIAMDQNNDGRISREEFFSLERNDQRAATQEARPR